MIEHPKNVMTTGNYARVLGAARVPGRAPAPEVKEDETPQGDRHSEHRQEKDNG